MKKYIALFIGLLAIISITLYNICSANTLLIMKESLENINYMYLALLIMIVFLYFIIQGTYMKIILKSLKTKISLLKGTFYSMVEFYFSGITPSSTGGQPVQLYFMTKDKIPASHTTITLILSTISFKVILIILGIWVLIFKNTYVFSYSFIYSILFFLGLITDFIMTFICVSLLFNQKVIKKVIEFLVKLGKKIPLISKKVSKVNVEKIVKNYKRETIYIKKHKKEVFLTFVLAFIQRLLFFSVAYIVYRGMGYNKVSYFELLAIQVSVQLTIEFFPLPGGAIVSENMLRDTFVLIFGLGVAEVGMIFTRLFSFYIPLIVCCIIIVTSLIKNRQKYLIK